MERTSVFDVLPGLPLIFKPVVDNYTSDPFVPRDPWKIIESGEFNQVSISSTFYAQLLRTQISKVKERLTA